MNREQWKQRPGALELPEKFDGWRAGQTNLIERIVESNARFVLVEAPTGSGKSLVAAAWQKLTGHKTLYMCTTKQLQDQVQDDFTYAEVLKGRANYPTRNFPQFGCDVCELTKTNRHCRYCAVEDEDGSWKHDCPYQVAKDRLLAADLGVVNTALFLTEANYVGRLSGWEQVVLDEADSIESQLMGFAELRVSKKVIRLLGLSAPEKKTVEEEWERWAEAVLRDIHGREAAIARMKPADRKSVENLEKRLSYFVRTLREKELHWVNCTEKISGKRGPWIWKPVRVADQANSLLWDHGEKWLLMSATVLSAEQFCQDLGLDRHDVDFIRLSSTFPVRNRPVLYYPVADMTYTNRDKTVPEMMEAIDAVLDRHVGEKVLIHAVSYWLTEQLFERSRHGRRLMRFREAGERQVLIQEFQRSQDDAVLVAPGLERGLDLPYDQCRVVIIPKLPYPSLADKQVNARLRAYRDGERWYRLQTARALVQATGRGVRSAEDSCVTYVLDKQFGKFYSRTQEMLPEWWKVAVESHPARELVVE